jgi:hypothetical protein
LYIITYYLLSLSGFFHDELRYFMSMLHLFWGESYFYELNNIHCIWLDGFLLSETEVKMKNYMILTDQTRHIGLLVTHTMLFLCSENVFHNFQIVLISYYEYYKLKQ